MVLKYFKSTSYNYSETYFQKLIITHALHDVFLKQLRRKY